MHPRFSILLAIGMLALGAHALGQGVIPGSNVKPLTVRGSVGFVGEAYATTGARQRRAPASGQVFANTTFNVLGFSSGLSLLYSTDESRFRQNMNRIGFSGSYKWLTLSAGDVSPRFSRYSLSGTTLRGALVELRPGPMMFTVTGGQSRRPVEQTDEDAFRGASFKQTVYGGRVGFGREKRTRFFINAVYGKDEPESIFNPGVDVRPTENLSISPELAVNVANGKVLLEVQGTVSAMSRDVRNDAIELSDVPGSAFLERVFRPRIGTNIDWAGEAAASFNLDNVGLRVAYDRVQPGFESLGLGRIRTDQAGWVVQPTIRMLDQRVNLSFNYTRNQNNLLRHLISTLQRQNFGASVQARVSNSFIISGNYMRMLNENLPSEAAPDPVSLHLRQVAQTFMLSPSLNLQRGGFFHSIVLTGIYQATDDQSDAVRDGLRPSSRFDNSSGTLAYVIRFPSGFAINTSGNVLQAKTSVSETGVIGANIGTGLSFFNRTANLSLSGGFARTQVDITQEQFASSSTASQVNGMMSLSIRLFSAGSLRFQVRGFANRDDATGSGFNEMQASARYEHRF